MKIKTICLFSLQTISRVLPSPLIKAPYSLSLKITRFILKARLDNFTHIWPRNSYISKALILGQSDLDLTIITNRSISKNEFLLFQQIYKKLKKFIPILSECNIYHSKSIEQFIDIANPFELKRDPIFIKHHLSTASLDRNCTPANASAYLLRMIEADYFNLSKRSARKKKWAAYLANIDKYLDTTPNDPLVLDELLAMALSIASCAKTPEESSFQIMNILHHKDNNDPSFLGYQYNQNLMFFFPQIWIGLAILRNQFNQDCLLLDTAPRWMVDVMLAQIDWELWGTFHQFYNISDFKHLISRISHLEIVIKLLATNNIQADKAKKRLSICKSLIQIISNFNS